MISAAIGLQRLTQEPQVYLPSFNNALTRFGFMASLHRRFDGDSRRVALRCRHRPVPERFPRRGFPQQGPVAYRPAGRGYFGHMWGLYAFWVLSPFLVRAALRQLGWDQPHWVGLGAFAVIGIGAVGCIGGGMLSRRWGSRAVASISMAVSGGMCVLSPFLLPDFAVLYLVVLLIWGIFVVSDSAQFSALSAQACPPEYVGTALTIQNSIGFAITVVSIEWTARLFDSMGAGVGWLLAPGPLLGLILLNWAVGREEAPAWEPKTGERGVEAVVAYPMLDFSAPERSGGPSLF